MFLISTLEKNPKQTTTDFFHKFWNYFALTQTHEHILPSALQDSCKKAEQEYS